MKYINGMKLIRTRRGNGPAELVGVVSEVKNAHGKWCELSNETGAFLFDYLDENYQLLPVVVIKSNGHITTAQLRNGKTVKKEAKVACNSSDTFDQYEGARIALARLFDVDPFPQDKPLYREVKRPAKGGEYIKIVDVFYGEYRYKNGEIFRVTHSYDGGVGVNVSADMEAGIIDTEYVVLEGYNPPHEPEKPVEVIVNGERYVKA